MIASAVIDSAMNWRNYLKIKVKSKGAKNKALTNNLFPPKILGESSNLKSQHLVEEGNDQTLGHSKQAYYESYYNIVNQQKYTLALTKATENTTTAVLSALKKIPTNTV